MDKNNNTQRYFFLDNKNIIKHETDYSIEFILPMSTFIRHLTALEAAAGRDICGGLIFVRNFIIVQNKLSAMTQIPQDMPRPWSLSYDTIKFLKTHQDKVKEIHFLVEGDNLTVALRQK